MVNPSAPVRRDEISELEYEGVTYKYDPFVNKYICGVCSAKSGQRQRMIQHIKDKHLGKSAIHVLTYNHHQFNHVLIQNCFSVCFLQSRKNLSVIFADRAMIPG